MKYYIGDTHFGHENVIKHDGRPFESVIEMDQFLIDSWNSIVTDNDEVYIDGDFTFRANKLGRDITWYARQLKGKKHLILGNHDKDILKNTEARKYFVSIEQMTHVRDNGHDIIVCHYPLAEWNGFFRGYYHVYAHIHNNTNEAYHIMKKYDKALNCGCMINNFVPVTLDQLIINNEVFKQNN